MGWNGNENGGWKRDDEGNEWSVFDVTSILIEVDVLHITPFGIYQMKECCCCWFCVWVLWLHYILFGSQHRQIYSACRINEYCEALSSQYLSRSLFFPVVHSIALLRFHPCHGWTTAMYTYAGGIELTETTFGWFCIWHCDCTAIHEFETEFTT